MFKKIIASISGWFTKEVPIVENAFTSANHIVNILKTLLGSASGQTIEAILDALAPGVAPAVFSALNTFFTDFGLVASETTKTPSEIAADGLTAISKLTGNSKVVALSNVASIIGHAISTGNNGGSTIQQAIVAAPLVYHPNLLDEVGAIVETVAPGSEAAKVAADATS
jgi:hypothetical protein